MVEGVKQTLDGFILKKAFDKTPKSRITACLTDEEREREREVEFMLCRKMSVSDSSSATSGPLTGSV